MEENKVTINMSELEKEIKELVDNFEFELSVILDNVEDYIKVEQDHEEQDTPKFKVGDVITGKEKNEYYITNNQSVLIVTEIESKHLIKVKVMDHKELDDEIGEEYEVDPKDFKLITDIL